MRVNAGHPGQACDPLGEGVLRSWLNKLVYSAFPWMVTVVSSDVLNPPVKDCDNETTGLIVKALLRPPAQTGSENQIPQNHITSREWFHIFLTLHCHFSFPTYSACVMALILTIFSALSSYNGVWFHAINSPSHPAQHNSLLFTCLVMKCDLSSSQLDPLGFSHRRLRCQTLSGPSRRSPSGCSSWERPKENTSIFLSHGSESPWSKRPVTFCNTAHKMLLLIARPPSISQFKSIFFF